MKKYLQVIGFITLALFSFYYTSKTSLVIKNTDEIMIKIKDAKESLKLEPIDALVEGNKIVPGIKGREVDISKSYDAMKKLGTYSSNLIVYKDILPNVSISKIYNKYINIGNPIKHQVTIIFKVDENDDVNSLLEILDRNNIKANIFVSDSLDSNILKLASSGHNVGIINNTWTHTLINRVSNQKNNYCYLEEENDEVLNICSMNKYYTIIPNIISNKTPTLVVKKELTNASIISLDVNKTLLKELEYIIRFIKSKGMEIVTLDTLLEE